MLVLAPLAGCIDAFTGSNVQFDFSPATPVETSAGAMPMLGELPSNIHFTLYAFQEDAMVGRLFAVQTFEIHHILDLASPCFIDDAPNAEFPGLHVSEYAAMVEQATGITDLANPPPGATMLQEIQAATAVTREMEVQALGGAMGINVVTSVSVHNYPSVAADCTDTTMIPPPMCTDDASNAQRLAMCKAAWKADPDYFEGTDLVLTSPLNGTTHGFVDGTNPVNLAPVGGAQFYVSSELTGFDGYAVYWQYDDADGDGKPDYPPTVPPAQQTETGTLLMFGTPTMPTRGVIHVHMTSVVSPEISADLAIFADLGDDDVSF